MGLKSALGLKKSQPNKNPNQLSCFPECTVLSKQSLYMPWSISTWNRKNFKVIYLPNERVPYMHTNVQHLKQCPIQFKGLENIFLQLIKAIVMILWFRKVHLLSEHLQESAVSHKAAILNSDYIKVWGLSGWLKENTGLSPMLITQKCNSKKLQLKIEYAFVHSWCPVQLQEGFSF